jgi:two-component system NtrC family sensor kinase
MNLSSIKDEEISLLWKVFDSMRMPAFFVTSDLKIVSENTSVNQKLSFSEDELEGTSITEILKTSPPLTAGLRIKYAVLEGNCLRKDRESFPAKITIISIPQGYIIVVEDITNILNIAKRATQRRRELNTYKALSETLSKTTEIKEMMRSVLDTLVNTLQIDAAWAYLRDEETGNLSLCCAKGIDERVFEDAKALKPYECFIGKVLSSEKALIVRDALEDPRITHIKLSEARLRSIAGVPLRVKSIGKVDDRVVGVLGVASREINRFTSLDMQFLTTVGNHLGVAIENARLIKSLKEKMRQIELINEITGIVNSSLSIGHIFRIVVSEVKKMVDFDRASITLIDENRHCLRIFAVDTKLPTELKKDRIAPLEGTSAGWVALNQKPWINKDLQEEIYFKYDSVLLKEGIRSTISLPLYKDRPIGSLNLDSISPEKYSEKDLEILMPIAKHLSIALENAMLFEEIYREKRQWEKTFDAITDMVWIEDLQGRVLRVNRTVIEKTGKPELALIQKGSDELLNLLKITPHRESIEGISVSKKRLYKELEGLDGTIYYQWSYPLLDSNGRTFGVVNYLRDVTEEKKLQQKLLMADKLASLGTLVAGIAHEINNPLGIIAGYAEALLDRAKDSELKDNSEFGLFYEYLDTINREIFRCKSILNSLLNFARPSTGTFRIVDINEVIREVVILIEHRARRQNKRIILDLNSNLPQISADPGALKQLFLNLIMNSLYFTEEDGVVRISTSEEVDLYGKRSLYIKISDNGRGIDKEILDRIFDPFFTTKPVGEGTGLGLAICHRIVTEHEGSIDVESAPEQGTIFHIRVPVKRTGIH